MLKMSGFFLCEQRDDVREICSSGGAGSSVWLLAGDAATGQRVPTHVYAVKQARLSTIRFPGKYLS